MVPRCWCGRSRVPHERVLAPNSCGRRCPSYQACKSAGVKCELFCQRRCHPGPCEKLVCWDNCALGKRGEVGTEKQEDTIGVLMYRCA